MLMSIQIFVFKFIKELLYTQSNLFCSFPNRVHGGEYLWDKGIFNFHCMLKIHQKLEYYQIRLCPGSSEDIDHLEFLYAVFA